MYIKDGMLFGNSDDMLMHIIQQMKGKELNIEDQGHPADIIGVNIKKLHDGTYEFTQYALINLITDDIDIGNSCANLSP